MSIAALITEGIGPGSSLLYVMTGGLDSGAAVTPLPAAPERLLGHGAGRRYAPPHKIIKRADTLEVDELKQIYAEARREIPERLQAGLLPIEYQIRSKRVTTLPPVRNVDFGKLIENLQIINVLIVALQEARTQALETARVAFMAKQKRRRDEESIIMLLLQD